MTVPDTHDFVDGVATSSEMNSYVRDPIRFLLNPPLARLRATATQSVANLTWTSVLFGAEDCDQANGAAGDQHSTSVNTSRFTCAWPGRYLVSGGVAFAGNTTGRRGTRVAINGALVEASGTIVIATSASLVIIPVRGTLVYLTVGDYVEIQALQESGGALNVSAAAGNEANSSMDILWVSN